MTTGRRTRFLAGLAVALAVFILQVATLREGHDWSDDFCLYLRHAANLAAGQPYPDSRFIPNPDYLLLSPRSYPPGFPALLAPVVAAAGLNLTAMKVVVCLAFALFLPVLMAIVARELSFGAALAVALVLSLNPYFLERKDWILSDLPGLLLLYLALWTLLATQDREGRSRSDLGWALLAGLLLYLAYSMRATAVALVPCLIVPDLIRLRRIRLFSLIAIAAFVALAALQALVLPSGLVYLELLKAGRHDIPHRIVAQYHLLRLLWVNEYSVIAEKLLSTALALLALAGYLLRIRRRRRWTILEIAPVALLAPIILFPGTQGLRYLIPLIPLVLFYAAVGLTAGARVLRTRARVAVYALLAAAIALTYAGKLSTLDFGPFRPGVSDPDAKSLFAWIREETPPDAVFLCRRPRAISLFADRSAAVFGQKADDARWWRFIEQIGADYCIRGPFPLDAEVLVPFLDRNRERLEKVWENPSFTVYRIASRLGESPP